MRKQILENAAYEVATQVRTVEDRIESAIAEIAELQMRMVHARGLSRAGMVSTHAAFEQLAATTNALVTARGGIAKCHAELAQLKATVPGVRTVSFGDQDDCPPPEGLRELRIVA